MLAYVPLEPPCKVDVTKRIQTVDQRRPLSQPEVWGLGEVTEPAQGHS